MKARQFSFRCFQAARFAIISGVAQTLTMPETRLSPDSAPPSYWRRNLRLILVSLLVWAALTFLPSYFARDLSFDFIGWPFAFWMAAYGAPLAYLVIVVVYARVMNRKDGDEDAPGGTR